MVEPHEKLATALSVAVRIEPELIRAVRLAIFPRFDVSAEADLWFSPLVRSRGPHGLVFDHDAVARLRTGLASWLRSAPPTDPVHRLGDVIASVHKRLSPALALEERVTWLAVTGRDDGIDTELLPALKALVQENRSGVADWFTAAWHRLPANARQSVTGWKLAQVVRPDLASSAPPLGLLRTSGDLDLSDIVSVLPDTRMLLRRNGNVLEVGDFEPIGDTVGIMVPDTDPRMLTVGTEAVTVRRGASIEVTVPPGPLRVSTARGVVYEVAAPRPARGLFLMIGGGVRVPGGLDAHDALAEVLGDDYVLRTPTLGSENMSLAVGELEAAAANDGPLVLCWRGPEEPQDGFSLRDLINFYLGAGGGQLLVLLDTPTPMWTEVATGLIDTLPSDAWIGLAVTPWSSTESLPAKLAKLLTAGPSTSPERRRWNGAGDRLTGFDVLEALSLDVGDTEPVIHAGNGLSKPMFRNPLYGRRSAETSAAPWFDISAEIDEAVRWARSGTGGMLVVLGSIGAGKTVLTEAVVRETKFIQAISTGWLASITGDLPPGVVIDRFDQDSDSEWIAEITRLGRRGMRFIITLPPRSDLLEHFRSAPVIDLDDLRAHVLRRLSGVDSEMSAEDIATFLIDTQNLSPALVRRTTRELHERPVSTRATGWQDRVLGALHASFDQDLDDDPKSRLLLAALAWAQGPGLPMDEWLACARVLPRGGTVSEDDARSALSAFGYYVSNNIRGQRLAHDSLVAYLKGSSDTQLRQRVFAALADLVPQWGSASSYLRNRLRDHAIEAGPASLTKLREMASWDSAWRPELGFVAKALAQRTTDSQRVDLARAAVEAYTEIVAKERKNITELRSALTFLEICLKDDGRTREAGQVWTEALKDLPANVASLVDQRSPLRPIPQPPAIRPNDLVVLVPGVKDNLLPGLRNRFTPLPDDLGDERPRGGPVDAVLDRDGYSAMLARLHGLGYTEDRGNLLPLPYDWRLSYRLTGQLIGERVEDALSAWRRRYNGNRTSGVVFVCVSTGGLPVRWYVERCGGARITSGVITIGTPVQGSVRALEKLVNGTWERGTAAFWRSLPSSYQTLPVYDCIQQRGGLARLTDVGLPGLDPARVADGVAFLDDLLAAEQARQDSLPTTHPIVGVRSETPTTARIVGAGLEVFDTARDTGSGDTYVPESAAKHPAKDTATRVPGAHDLLHRRPAVLNAVAELLRPTAGSRLQ